MTKRRKLYEEKRRARRSDTWIKQVKENFLSKLNADVEKQYIKDFVSRSGTNER